MKILIIGHSVVDKIFTNTKEFIKPGGIFYSTISFLNLSNDDDQIYLMTNLDKLSYNYFSFAYDKVNLELSSKVKKIPIVNLNIYENRERDEAYENFTSKIEVNFDYNYSQFDGIFLSLITGLDISLEDLYKLRELYNGIIYMDVHSLARGIKNNKRYFRQIPNSIEWLKNVNILQANENEVKTICEFENETDIARFVLNNGPKILLVTKGKIGARLFYMKDGGVESVFVPAIKVNSVNSVGCGDTFGASFFYSYIHFNDIYYALKFANIAAGYSTMYSEVKQFNNLKNDIFTKLNKE